MICKCAWEKGTNNTCQEVLNSDNEGLREREPISRWQSIEQGKVNVNKTKSQLIWFAL